PHAFRCALPQSRLGSLSLCCLHLASFVINAWHRLGFLRLFGGFLSMLVERNLRQGCEGLIRVLLLRKSVAEELGGIAHAQFLCPRDQGSVAGNLVMFDSLRPSEKP